MNVFFLLCVLSQIIFPQKEIYAYYFNFDEEARAFENVMLNDIIDLYNNKKKKNLILKFIEVKKFENLFLKLENGRHDKMIISSITITNKRKKLYDFSPIYIPTRNCILGLKSKNFKDKKKWEGLRIAYMNYTTEDDYVINIAKKYKLIAIPFSTTAQKIDLLLSNKSDLILSEVVSTLKDDRLEILDIVIKKNIGYGIVFPKGSHLNKELKPIINYYIKSAKYYRLLKSFVGKKISRF